MSNKNDTICLNMIVKNESHIIIDTLKKLVSKINFDYYVICDTGSTDNTCDLIKLFFDSKKINGEIFFHEWKDFAYNRSLALKCAFGKSDYVFIFDADDSIEGNFVLPELTLDSYMLKFGNESSAYERLCLVKNDNSWYYRGVLHEYICSKNENVTKGNIPGDYYIISGRTSTRNLDSQKYLKDAKILEKGYYSSINSGDDLHHRYAYYCANSYFDSGPEYHEKAKEWYLKTLNCQGWYEERYNACLKLFEITTDQTRYYYLVESFYHNPRRVEGIYQLIQHYTCEAKYNIAWKYYQWIQNYFENEIDDLSTKLFANVPDYVFYLPYYMIIVSEQTKNYSTGIKMYKIIFEKKFIPPQWWLNNLIYNFQFYISHADNDLFEKMKHYFLFLESHNLKLDESLIRTFEKYGFKYYSPKKKILFYTGFSDNLWNISYSEKNALGGSERAIIYLAKELSKYYSVIISGDVLEENVLDISFIHRSRLNDIFKVTTFDCIIISRYVSFFTIFPNFKSKKVILMAHDTHFINNLQGCERLAKDIVNENKIDYCVCLTDWHTKEFKQEYPNLTFKTINNGINPELFSTKNNKVSNSFIYTSCSWRGLNRVLELWDSILEYLPDAKLNISSYEELTDEITINYIQKYPSSIKHHGKLNQKDLYNLMSTSEFWLYPCNFNETSCITAMEMLISEVICIYYPIAGLTDTMKEYGIQTSYGNEINSILDLSARKKLELRKNGLEYALSCSWNHRSLEWKELIDNENVIKIINLKRREDRKEQMISRLKEQKINNYEFIEAIDGKEISASKEIQELFKGNDHNYRKGVIGCALTHIKLWKELINDNVDYYIILEDDICFCENFKEKLNKSLELFESNSLDFLAFGSSNISPNEDPFVYGDLKINLLNEIWTGGLFGYIISKNACKSLIKNMEGKSLTRAIDFEIIKYKNFETYFLNYSIVKPYFGQPENDTDIQHHYNDVHFNFSNNLTEISIKDLDYLINKKIVFYAKWHFATELLKEYIDSLNTKINVKYTNSIEYIKENNFDEIIIVHEIADKEIFELNVPVSYINTEPLNLWPRLCYVLYDVYKKYPQIKNFYDYSFSNIKIMNQHGILNTIHLPYLYNEPEINFLKEQKTKNKKEYDFGIISSSTVWTNKVEELEPPRRRKVVEHLLKQGFKVNIISGFDYTRDIELSKCDTILNIHGAYFEDPSKIFEHIRCNRLLFADYSILSESSEYIYPEFLINFPKLKFIDYEDFFKINNNKIIDCFTFYNEIDLLKYRLNILNPVVDYFILVEATLTHVGKKKQLYFENNKHLFEKFKDKIIHVIVDDFPFNEHNINIQNEEQWLNEKFQRNCITRGLELIDVNNNDIITVCDLDEIPDPKTLLNLKNSSSFTIGSFEQDFYYYNLNSKMDHLWYHAKCFKYSYFIESNKSFSDLRLSGIFNPIIKGGWHLSYFGSSEFISNKIKNFGHQEYNSDTYTNINSIIDRIKNGLDLYNRPINIQFILTKNNDYLPPRYIEFLNNFITEPDSLNYLSLKYFLDKNGYHNYIPIYDLFLNHKRNKINNVLEIGIGSVENGQMKHVNNYKTGNSLRCWRDYFPNAIIHGIDIYECDLNEERIKTYLINQTDSEKLNELNYKFDLIIDDGSHILEDQVYSFKILESKLSTDGIYVIEDIQDMEPFKKSILCFEENYNIHYFNNLSSINIGLDNVCVFEKKHKTIHVCGKEFMGLGNLMFQIAEAVYYCEKFNYQLNFNDKFNRLKNYNENIFKNINTLKYEVTSDVGILNNNYHNNKIEPIYNDILVTGYSQNIDLFYEIKDSLFNYFYINDPDKINYVVNKYSINENDINVMIGFRLAPDGGFKYKSLGMSSYENVMNTIINKNKDKKVRFFVLSDIDPSEYLINCKLKVEIVNENDIHQFYLGLQCNHFILGESTFHYWIALLKYIKDVSSEVYIFKETDLYFDKTKEISENNRNLNLNWNFVDQVDDGFTFYLQKDQSGYDFINYNSKSVPVLKELAIHNKECIAFNTMGYFKNKLPNITPLVGWGKDEGIYIKELKESKVNYCFIHSCTTNNTKRLDYLVQKIQESKLNDSLEKIIINNIGIPIKNKWENDKIQIINYSDKINLFEIPTINKLLDFSKQDKNINVLYLHTKGITCSDDYQEVNDWIDLMLYFLVEQYQNALNKLKDVDTVGCNYLNNKECPPHWSGNFWWAKGNYIATLPKCSPNKMDAEFWLMKNNPKYHSLHQSDVNHYYQKYPRERYVSILHKNNQCIS